MWKRILLTSIVLVIIAFLAKATYGIATAPPLGAHFPQTMKHPRIYLDALVKGELVLEHGCLRVKKISGDSVLLIWDPRFSTRTEQGFVQVIDSSTGEVQVSAGDYVEAGGGSFPRGTWLKQPIPKECPGPYWLVGEYIKKIDGP